MRSILIAAVLSALVSLAAPAQSPPALVYTVDRFLVEGDNPLESAATDAALAPFLGEHAGIEGLFAATDALKQALAAAGHVFHRVTLPPQELDGGTVVLKVVSFGLGEVDIRGQRHFSEDSVRRSLTKVIAAGSPDLPEVSRSLAVANQHPLKQLRVNFRESETLPDSLDAVVTVDDQRHWNVFGNINNIGNKDTGRTRLLLGAQHGNVTKHDDVLTATVSTSPDNADDVFQFGAFYQLPVYAWSGWFSAFYVRSDIDVGNVQDFFDISGSGDFFGVSFKRQLLPVGRYRHSLTAGLQDRGFETAIFNAATGGFIPGISTKVRSRPFSLRYDGGYNWIANGTSLDFYVEWLNNLSFGGHNDDQAYARVRPAAESQWKAMRFSALVTTRLPRRFTGLARISGQYTNEALIPGEQFGVGGERTVRGFEERAVAGDQGLIINLEAWSPQIQRLWGTRLLAFVDVGTKWLEEPIGEQRFRDTLASIGVGARWQWQDKLQFSLDYGQVIRSASGEAADRGNAKWHVNLLYRY